MSTLLAVEDLHTYYGEAHILQGISLEVGEREVVTLIERSVVVLPAPLRPMSVTTSRSPTSSEMPCRMWASP